MDPFFDGSGALDEEIALVEILLDLGWKLGQLVWDISFA